MKRSTAPDEKDSQDNNNLSCKKQRKDTIYDYFSPGKTKNFGKNKEENSVKKNDKDETISERTTTSKDPLEDKTEVPKNSSEWMGKCIEKWDLQPPYIQFTDEKWKQYFQERSCLDWRHENEWQNDGRRIENEKEENGQSSWHLNQEKLQEKWTIDWTMPKMRQSCLECYADDETEKEEYMRFWTNIHDRVKETGETCSKLNASLTFALQKSAYILQYWVNREEPGKDGQVRTVHFENRFYSPVGNGNSFDIYFKYHFRSRSSYEEKSTCLHVIERSIDDCHPDDPTSFGKWSAVTSNHCDRLVVKLLDQDGKKKAVHAKKGALKELGSSLFQKSGVMSERKIWMLFARAGGLCTTGDKTGVYFNDARRKYGKLPKNEDSDNEEDDTGPGCILM